MSDDEAPRHGARFLFELAEVRGSEARYRVAITTPEARSHADAVVTPDTVRVGGYDGAVEPWAQKSAVAFLEVVARAFDDEIGWPRRVQRWRQARD